MKASTQAVYDYLLTNRNRAVPSNELLRRLNMTDYRARISEIRRHLRETGSSLRVASRRIPGRRTNEYRLEEASDV